MDWREGGSSAGRVDYPEMARLRRKKRRRRATLLAWSAVAVLLFLIVGSGAFLIARNRGKRQEKPVRNQQAVEEASRAEVLGEQRKKQEETKTSALSQTDLRKEQVRKTISGMTLEEKVAGLFVISEDQWRKDRGILETEKGEIHALTGIPVGGLAFSSADFTTKEQLHSLLQETKAQSKYPLFLLPEGDGSWLRGAVTGEPPSSASSQEESVKDDLAIVTEAHSEDVRNEVEEEARENGIFLKNLGFNLCLLPCANLTEEGGGNASTSLEEDATTEAQTVAENSTAIVRGLQAGGIWPAAGNFPVAGEEDVAGKTGITECQKEMGRLQTEDFVPFRNCMSQDVPLIQMSNVILTRADIDPLPCSLSSGMIEEQLRKTLGYDGIVMTDALNQRAVTDRFTSEAAAVDALLAGADLVYLPENFAKAYQGVLDAVESGTLTEERIDASLSRIYKIKLSQS